MDKLSVPTSSAYILEILNEIRLYLRISRRSDVVNEEGTNIQPGNLYGPPAHSNLTLLKRQKILQSNMKSWRECTQETFC